jgi:hypothetical protein
MRSFDQLYQALELDLPLFDNEQENDVIKQKLQEIISTIAPGVAPHGAYPLAAAETDFFESMEKNGLVKIYVDNKTKMLVKITRKGYRWINPDSTHSL